MIEQGSTIKRKSFVENKLEKRASLKRPSTTFNDQKSIKIESSEKQPNIYEKRASLKNNINNNGISSNKKNEIAEKSSKLKKKGINLKLDIDEVNSSSNNNFPQTTKNKEITEEDIEEIFDQEYHEKIDIHLNGIWEKAEENLKEKLALIEEKIMQFLDDIMVEKFRKLLEINEKFDREMREMENDVDFSDETNINTIVYNQLKEDKINEISDLNADIENRKRDGLKNIREESSKIQSDLEKNQEISKIKNDLSQNIKSRIIKSLTPKEAFSKKFDFSKAAVNSNKFKLN